MAELFIYFGSAEFLGIILLTGGVCFLLTSDFYGWFDEDARKFFLPKLSYENSDTQSLVRTTWLCGIIILLIGAIVVSVNNPENNGSIGWIMFEIVYLFVSAWILRKLILLAAITVSSLWNWAVHGTPLFKKEIKKEESQKGDA